MVLVIARSPGEDLSEQERAHSEKLLKKGKAVEKAAVDLTVQIREMNELYKDRLDNKRSPRDG